METPIVAIWIVLILIGAFAPIRWSIVALFCLSIMDFRTGRMGVGNFNLIKGIILPAYLYWRLRRFAGHGPLRVAPIAWLLLAAYAYIAGSWSLFPASAHKLVVQMLASFLIFCVCTRAAKGGYLTPHTAIWVAAGSLVIGVIRSIFFPEWEDDPSRFTGFIPAQAFAALMAACYCIVLCGKGLRITTRVTVCSLVAIAIVMSGSRIWFLGIVLGSLLNLIVSRGQVWLKVCAFAAMLGLLGVLIGTSEFLFAHLESKAHQNRIAAAITAVHRNDRESTGLGTLNFRRQINSVAIRRIKGSNTFEFLFGRGTCNGAMISAALFPNLYPTIVDPNRMMHNEWFRVMYEWGITGAILWLLFIGSAIRYAIDGVRLDPSGNAKPLLLYFPPFLIGLAGENIIPGANTAANMGFIFVLALSTVPHREFLRWRIARLALRMGQHRRMVTRPVNISGWDSAIKAR